MANKPAVSQAQMQRMVKAMEAIGKVAYGVETLVDGTVRVLLTPPASAKADESGSWAEYDRKHGYAEDDGSWAAFERKHGFDRKK